MAISLSDRVAGLRAGNDGRPLMRFAAIVFVEQDPCEALATGKSALSLQLLPEYQIVQ
jgi:hypothetical protein